MSQLRFFDLSDQASQATAGSNVFQRARLIDYIIMDPKLMQTIRKMTDDSTLAELKNHEKPGDFLATMTFSDRLVNRRIYNELCKDGQDGQDGHFLMIQHILKQSKTCLNSRGLTIYAQLLP